MVYLFYLAHRLQQVQNTAAHIVTRRDSLLCITPMLKSLYWLPVNYRINFKICCITHLTLTLHEPHYFSSLFSLRSNFHYLHPSSLAHALLLPYFNKKLHGFRSFSYAAPHLWNHQSYNIRTASTYTSF